MGDILMAYGTLLVDGLQSSTAGTPPLFYDGSSAQIGTLCRAWVNFTGTGSTVIGASFNVSSVTYNSAGTYTVNFSNALPDAKYNAMVTRDIGAGATYTCGRLSGGTYTAGSVTVSTVVGTALTDAGYICVAIFR